MLFETSLTPLPVFGLRREMNRLFDDVLTRTSPTAAFAPPVDVCESENDITFSIELPGVRPEDVELTADNGMVTVRGQKSPGRPVDGTEYHMMERSYGSFTRSFRLPKSVDDSRIRANFAHGVLEITVPKSALPQPKKIVIESQDGDQRVSGTAQRPGHAQKSVPLSENK